MYNGSRYYYVLNQQGDVIRIVGYLGATLCEYQYDAWGNVLAITVPYAYSIGNINPIRYRGYFYDSDTGFYYLQSRYYDPSIGRFINADSFASTGQGFIGYNMFVYCLNNPVNNKDNSGCYSICVVTGKDTQVVGEDSEATYYATTITYHWMDTRSPVNASESQTTIFYYHIKNNGIVVYDNAQESSVNLLSSQLCASLASEMLSESQKKLPGALAGRTIWGMAFELQAHFLASIVGFKLGNTNVTEMGSSTEDSVDYDYNADWFERPWCNIPEIGNALFN